MTIVKISTLFALWLLCSLSILVGLTLAIDPVYNISTFVGGGSSLGDGGLAINAQLSTPYGLAMNSIGELYVADTVGRVRKVDVNGYVSTVAGTGIKGLNGESKGNGGLATLAMLGNPLAVAVSENGELYIVEQTGQNVRKVLTNGTIVAFAGNNLDGYTGSGFSGDDGPAINAKFSNPSGVAISSTGEVFISDSSNRRIRSVSSNGTISTYAGTGSYSYGGEGGPATSASFSTAGLLSLSSNGDLYCGVSLNDRVFKVSKNGIFSTLAGGAGRGYSGDGGMATSAQLNLPIGSAVGKYGEIYIGDRGNHLIRKVSSNGIITTIAGIGQGGFSGDGGLATSAAINNPLGIIVDSNGVIYFSDSDNKRIRKLVPYCTDGILMNGTCVVSCNGIKSIDSHVCNGHGSCIATNNCVCESGWNGDVYCSTISCELVNNCSGNGICVSNNTCSCNSGWKGNSQCSHTSCDGVNYCNGNGQCISNNTCLCDSGWRGNNQCSAISCDSSNDCSGHGTCVSNNTCSCNSGWKGDSVCSQFTCETLHNCSEHGSCISNNTCLCHSGWKGNSECSQFNCDGLNGCNTHGTCISNNTCLCESGWRGSNQCSAISCDMFGDCNGHGYCVSNNTCSCNSGWKGNSQCSHTSCDGVNYCNGNGQCISNNTCLCDSGWRGNNQCSAISCDSSVNCNGHGSCISNNTCSCYSGWNGDINCSTSSCEGVNNCSGQGSCTANNTCTCNSQRKFVDCSISECLVSLDTNTTQLSCSSSASSATIRFTQLQANTFNNLLIELNSGNQRVISPSVTSSNLNVSSMFFLSSSSTHSNFLFYSNITNLLIQNSNSTLILTTLSNAIEFNFNNLVIDKKSFNYACLRFDYHLNKWTNSSILTTILSNEITCSTNQVTTSVVIQRTISPVKSFNAKNSTIPIDSGRVLSNTSLIAPSIILLSFVFLFLCFQ